MTSETLTMTSETLTVCLNKEPGCVMQMIRSSQLCKEELAIMTQDVSRLLCLSFQTLG